MTQIRVIYEELTAMPISIGDVEAQPCNEPFGGLQDSIDILVAFKAAAFAIFVVPSLQ